LGLAICTLGACTGSTGTGASKSGDGVADSPTETALHDSATQKSDAATQKPRLGTPQPKLPVGTVVLETAPREPLSLKVEVASTDAQRQMGMMFRETLGEDEGMLFVFPTERVNNFWMRNTLIPLDMLFIDSEWQVVGIVENATPLTDDPRGVGKMSQYVLEVTGGFAARHGLGVDTQVRFTPPTGMNP